MSDHKQRVVDLHKEADFISANLQSAQLYGLFGRIFTSIESLLAANDELEKDKAKLIRESELETDLRQHIATLEREKAEITASFQGAVATGIQQRDKISELEKRVKELEATDLQWRKLHYEG